MSNLSQILSEKSMDMLQFVKTDIEERENAAHYEMIERIKQRKREYYSAKGFKNRQELIDYVKGGNTIYRDELEGYMRLCPEKGENVVVNYRMTYDEYTDVPMGMKNEYLSWDEFVKWTEWMDEPRVKEQGYVDYWVKEN